MPVLSHKTIHLSSCNPLILATGFTFVLVVLACFGIALKLGTSYFVFWFKHQHCTALMAVCTYAVFWDCTNSLIFMTWSNHRNSFQPLLLSKAVLKVQKNKTRSFYHYIMVMLQPVWTLKYLNVAPYRVNECDANWFSKCNVSDTFCHFDAFISK